MGEKEPLEDKSESHGICPPCFQREWEFAQKDMPEKGLGEK